MHEKIDRQAVIKAMSKICDELASLVARLAPTNQLTLAQRYTILFKLSRLTALFLAYTHDDIEEYVASLEKQNETTIDSLEKLADVFVATNNALASEKDMVANILLADLIFSPDEPNESTSDTTNTLSLEDERNSEKLFAQAAEPLNTFFKTFIERAQQKMLS